MASPSPKKPIVLLAGHGGRLPGAVVVYGGRQITEAALACRLRDDVTTTLRGDGYTVITDGEAGQNLNLQAAVAIARRYNSVECEIHFNSVVDKTASGVEAYASAANRLYAERLATSTARALDLDLRGRRGWKLPEESQHKGLAIVSAGAVLLEVCFLSNPNDYASFQRNYARLVQAIAFELARWSDNAATFKPAPQKQPSFPVAPSPTHPQPVPPIYPEPAQRPPMQVPAIASGQPAARGVWATISAALVAAWSMGAEWINAHMHQIGLAVVVLAFVWLVWRMEQINYRCNGSKQR